MSLLLWLLASPSSACTPAYIVQDYEIEADPDDTVAPLEPVVTSAHVGRGEAKPVFPSRVVPCVAETSGVVSFALQQHGEPVEQVDTGMYRYDDLPPVGYRFRVVDGALPPELEMHLTDQILYGTNWGWDDDGTLEMGIYVHWHDPPRRQEPFAATLEVVAVDRAGNVGAPLLVEVQDDGAGTGCGCAAAPGAAHGWPLLLAALGVRRRKARSSNRSQAARPPAG